MPKIGVVLESKQAAYMGIYGDEALGVWFDLYLLGEAEVDVVFHGVLGGIEVGACGSPR